MTQITIQPPNPLDVRPEDLQSLAEGIRRIDSSYEVRIEFQPPVPGRYGVTWPEVVNIFISASGPVGNALIGALVTQGVNWARERFRKKDDGGSGARRPKSINIYGPDGKRIKRVELSGPDAEPEESAD